MATEVASKEIQSKQTARTRLPLFARLPLLGIIIFILGALAFAGFALDLVNHGPMIKEDQTLALSLHQTALADPPAVSDAIHVSAFWLGREIAEGIGIILSVYFLIKRYWRYFWMIALGTAGGGAVWYLLTRFFNRPRPSFPVNLEHLTDPSFPSGHTLNSVIVFGIITYLLLPHLYSRAAKILVILAVLAMVIYVGYGRLFAGGHYLTDVLSGYAVGIAWAALVATLVDWWFFRRKPAQQ